MLAEVDDAVVGIGAESCNVVMSLSGIQPRDGKYHVAWLVGRHRFEEAFDAPEAMGRQGKSDDTGASEIGQRYIEHLISDGE